MLTLINTPASVKFGTADAIDQDRQNTSPPPTTLIPSGSAGRPHPPVMPPQFWINEPEVEPQMN